MPHALTIGGTQFIGRHTVEELLAHDYAVTTFTRGEHPNPFADSEASEKPRGDGTAVDSGSVDHYAGDRQNREDLEAARDAVDPDVVIDFVAMVPDHVETACEVFADVDAYVYVSSAAAYARPDIPQREDATPLHEYDPAADDEPAFVQGITEFYGPRKAAGDRAVFAAAADGVNAVSVRPVVVYGPHDYTERVDYWIDRVANHDRVLVPADGQSVFHRVFVADVASALRIVAERGEAGEAYNVGDQRAVTLDDSLQRIAAALDTDVELVHACERELADAGLAYDDFPLYLPFPAIASTAKLEALGWESTPLEAAYAETVAEHRESDRTGAMHGPDRETEGQLLDSLGD